MQFSDSALQRIRADFPALRQKVHGKPLVYLDNAASTQKPRSVIQRISDYYANEHSNVHRGAHSLSQRATEAYEGARRSIAQFIGAAHPHEIIFTRGATEAINLVASSFGRSRIGADDEIVITGMEHHSNMVPWQMLCEEKGCRLRILLVNDRGEVPPDALEHALSPCTKLVSIAHVSNSLGTINPVREMIARAHACGVPVLVDGAQAAPHMAIDVQALDCDFYCFSGHKVFGPTGIGVLYGKEALLDAMPPYQGGGDMIETVTYARATYSRLPHKFEAGTPHIAGVLGLEAALDYVENLGLAAIEEYERNLLAYARERLLSVDGLRLVGDAKEKASVLSFLLGEAHPYDVGEMLDHYGVAVRTGHHCAMPLMRHLGIPGTVRASLAFYNTRDEADILAESLCAVRDQLCAVRGRPQKAETTSIEERRRDMVADFCLFDDLEQKREYLMELGEGLPEFEEAYRTDAHRIWGCQSMAWLRAETTRGRISFHADSNAMITKGMIAVLVRLLNHQTPQAILDTDLQAFLMDIGLLDLITARRKNGLQAMVTRIKLEAHLGQQPTSWTRKSSTTLATRTS